MAYKYDLVGKKVGKLTVKRLVPIEERPSASHGNYWYCDCDCGNTNVMVPTSYLTGNGNYLQTSCGCERKRRAFLASCKMEIDNTFLDNFPDFERFLFLHKRLTLIRGKKVETYNINEYKSDILYFYHNQQFNTIYDFWQRQERTSTYYDWAKPSVDHIIPKSKNGSDKKENLQFLTVFENLNKRDMTWEEWISFKQVTNTTSDYYLESIMQTERGEGSSDTAI